MIDGEALTLRRTAAASLLAARYLARNDARQVLIVGTGRLARFMAHAHCAGRDIERLLIWGRSAESAAMARVGIEREGLPAEAVDDLEPAVHEADIVSCATTATRPVVRGAWLAPGTHLDLVGAFKRNMREVDDEAVARSSVVGRYLRRRAGRGRRHHRAHSARCHSRGDIRGELAELVTGSARAEAKPTRSRCSNRSALRSRTWQRRRCCSSQRVLS